MLKEVLGSIGDQESQSTFKQTSNDFLKTLTDVRIQNRIERKGKYGR